MGWLRARREAVGLTQHALAKRSGVRQPLISALETGRRQPTEPTRAALVAAALPQEFTSAHPDVDWTAISRMRNLVAHHYDQVNDDLMWSALAVRVPAMLAALSGR